MLTCLIGDKQLKGAYFRPVVINRLSQPEVVSPGEPVFDRITGIVSELSAVLGTTLHPEGDKVWALNKTP